MSSVKYRAMKDVSRSPDICLATYRSGFGDGHGEQMKWNRWLYSRRSGGTGINRALSIP